MNKKDFRKAVKKVKRILVWSNCIEDDSHKVTDGLYFYISKRQARQMLKREGSEYINAILSDDDLLIG